MAICFVFRDETVIIFQGNECRCVEKEIKIEYFQASGGAFALRDEAPIACSTECEVDAKSRKNLAVKKSA